MELHVDNQAIRMNPFVLRVVSNIIDSLIDSLDDIPENPERIVLVVEGQTKATIEVDGQNIRMNSFVQKIVGNVLYGIIDSLDDVPSPRGTVKISI